MRTIFLILLGLSLSTLAQAEDTSKVTQETVKSSSEVGLPKVTPPCDPEKVTQMPETFY